MSFLEERDVARWGRQARAWLTHDDRGRMIGLVVLSLAISIAMSLMATVIVGFVSRRQAAVPADVLPPDVGEPMADVAAAPEGPIGIPVMVAEGEPAKVVGA